MCRSFQTLVNLTKLILKTSQTASQKQSTPPIFRMVWRGAFRTQPSEEGVRLSRTGNSNLTTWIGETKNPASHDENWRGHFFAMMLETGAQGVCEERRSPYLIRWVTNRIRCIFINTVLKAAKNFQFVNFFTSRFPNKKPRQPFRPTGVKLWEGTITPLGCTHKLTRRRTCWQLSQTVY